MRSTSIPSLALVVGLLLATQGGCGSRPGSVGQGADDGGDGSSGGGTDGGGTDDTGEESPVLAGPQGLLVAQSWDREEAPFGEGAGRYRVIVLQESMYSLLEDVRVANPDATVLAYQKAGGMKEGEEAHSSTGVRIHEAEDGHEDWFLHDEEGNRLYYCDYEGVAAANMGSESYQQRWLVNVSARILGDGFDGVMMDDVNTFPGHCLGSKGTAIAEFATDEAYGDAVVAFMAAVGPELKELGLVVAPNVAMNPWDDVMRAQTVAMFPSISHLDREYWMRWDDSANFRGDEWLQTLTLMEDAQSAGLGFLGLTYGPGLEGVGPGQRYGRASFLLAWDGQSDSAWGYLDEEVDPWSAVWEPDLGLPEGDRVEEGAGWMRRYSGGTVCVNPHPTSGQTFDLEEPHVDLDGVETSTVTLQPGEAAILLR